MNGVWWEFLAACDLNKQPLCHGNGAVAVALAARGMWLGLQGSLESTLWVLDLGLPDTNVGNPFQYHSHHFPV